ncbi:MAG: ABC transporter permease [Candidatus Polarisedimenticolia bacterium]
MQEIRHAARRLKGSPSFTLVAVVTLALAIAGNTTVLSVLDAIILSPLPYPHPERLVRIYESNVERGWSQFSTSAPNYKDWRDQNRSFEEIAAWRSRSFTWTGGQEAERVGAGCVSAPLLPLLGARPALGRLFVAGDDAPGSPRVAMLSHGFWKRAFGGRPDVAGQPILLDGQPHEVIGVLSEGFPWFGRADVMVPLAHYVDDNRDNHVLSVFGLLREGATLLEASAEMETLAARLAVQYPGSNRGWSVSLESFDQWIVGEDLRRSLLVLTAAVGAVLLIACANVASLLLMRATGRSRELAIRAALGAGRWRLVRELLTESLLLSVAGGAVGLLLSVWGLELARSLGGDRVPRLDEAVLNVRVLVFMVGVSLLTGLVFGLGPALNAARSDPSLGLAEGGRGSGPGRRARRVRQVLVAAEMTLSVVLLIMAGLLLRSFASLQDVEPGFRSDGVVTMQIGLPGRYDSAEKAAAFHVPLLEKVRTLPGVEAAAEGSILPFEGGNTTFEVRIEGRSDDTDDTAPSADWRMISPSYFRTLGIPTLLGRDFDQREGPGGSKSVIVSATMARRYWPDQDPIGRRLQGGADRQTWWTVVGVVGDVKHLSLDTDDRPVMYIPIHEFIWNPTSLAIRTTMDADALVQAVRGAVRSLDADVPVYGLNPMDEFIRQSVAARRFSVTLLVLFASVALLLSAVGCYGVMAYAVTERRHEMGVRLALGAQGRDLVLMVARQAGLLAAVSIVVGVGAALALGRLVSSLLYGVTATDPVTLAAVPCVLGLTVLAASWGPARRAARLDPLRVLRQG